MHWVYFNLVLLLLLGIDITRFRKRAPTFKHACLETCFWVGLALIFNAVLYFYRSPEDALKFFTGYLIEYSLSVDNLFVFLTIFQYFRVPKDQARKILFYGIMGAIVMRALMILFGIVLVKTFQPILYLFGAFLIFASIKLFFAKEKEFDPEKNLLFRLGKKWGMSQFALILLMVETTDAIFALDSIPAIFAITLDPFIVYTSNILAILGLRSLYFVLAEVMQLFKYLHYGLAGILFFVGLKMLLHSWITIPLWLSLSVIAALIALSILASFLFRNKRR